MNPTELILVRFLPLMDYILYRIYEEDGFLGPRPDVYGQVQDFKSNAQGISFGEDWPEEINYHYIRCKRDSQANRLKHGYTYSITHWRELTFAPS